jgi:transposase
MYFNFTKEKLYIVDKDTGQVKEVEVFAAILGCSQLTYIETVMTQLKGDMVKVWENPLHYFGGVHAAIEPDNLRSAVTKSSKYKPIINETLRTLLNTTAPWFSQLEHTDPKIKHKTKV